MTKKIFVLKASFGSIREEFSNYQDAFFAYRDTICPKTLISIDENRHVKVIHSHS